LLLKLFFFKKSVLPELLITPRGLITVLLFFSIPAELASDTFNSDIILITILATSIIMTWGLIRYSNVHPPKEAEEVIADALQQTGAAGEVSYFVSRMSDETKARGDSKASEEVLNDEELEEETELSSSEAEKKPEDQ